MSLLQKNFIAKSPGASGSYPTSANFTNANVNMVSASAISIDDTYVSSPTRTAMLNLTATYNYNDGTPGVTKGPQRINCTITNANDFIYAQTIVVINNASTTDHTGSFIRYDKGGAANSYGQVINMRNISQSATGAMVAQEIDMLGNGSNSQHFAKDIIARRLDGTSAKYIANTGIRIRPDASAAIPDSALAAWLKGIDLIGEFQTAPINFQSSINGVSAGICMDMVQGQVITSSQVLTVLAQIPLSANRALIMDGLIVGHRTDFTEFTTHRMAAAWRRVGGGVVATMGAPAISSFQSTAAVNVGITADNSANNCRITVSGENAINWSWALCGRFFKY